MSNEHKAHNELARQAELSLIAADMKFILDLLFNVRPESAQSIGGLAFQPFMSMFLYESSDYARQRYPSMVAVLKPHRDVLYRARLRTKLLDNDRPFDELIREDTELTAISSGWFLNSKFWLLRQLKRLVQPDLSLFFAHNEVFCTTHVGYLNMGVTEPMLSDELGRYLRATSEEFGQYIVNLAQVFPEELAPAFLDSYSEDSPKLWLSETSYRDFKSRTFYDEMATRIAPSRPEISLQMMSLLSQVNAARLVAPRIAQHNESALLKIQCVTLFHTVLSLQQLLNRDHESPFLQNNAREQFKAIQRNKLIRQTKKLRRLRANLVHYGIPEGTVPHLSSELPLFGLVEAHMGGKSFQKTLSDVAHGLEIINNELRTLLPESATPKKQL